VVSPGNNVTYTIIVTQLGKNGYARVRISDTLGDGITFTGQPGYNGSDPKYKGEYSPDGKSFSVTIDITYGLAGPNNQAWQLIAQTTNTNYNSIPNPVYNYLVISYSQDINPGDERFTNGNAGNPVLLGAAEVTMSKKIIDWKTSKGTLLSDASLGDVLTYQYVITNMGTITLYNLQLTDSLIISTNLISDQNSGLITPTAGAVRAISASIGAKYAITVVAPYVVKTEHIVGQNITNTANFTADFGALVMVNGKSLVTQTIQTSTLITSVPEISISKEATWTSVAIYPTVGDWVTYTYHITNYYAGNMIIATLNDSKLGDIGGYHQPSMAGGIKYTLTPLSSTILTVPIKLAESHIKSALADINYNYAAITDSITYTNYFTVGFTEYNDGSLKNANTPLEISKLYT
jgi:uncharacterized repeat protein (TIGR01451 family)